MTDLLDGAEHGALISDAVISACGRYRYSLTRIWDLTRPMLPICGLNPSTADATKNDATIRREINFATRFGYGGLLKVNLFALRSRDPKALLRTPDRIGPDNDKHILQAATSNYIMLCAWGGMPKALAPRAREVERMLSEADVLLYCLGATADAEPRHPLYLRGDAIMQPRFT